MVTGLWRTVVLLLALAASTHALAQPTPRAELRPDMDRLDLAPYLTYKIDADAHADSADMFDAANAGAFRPLPGGRPTFSFVDGAYWFHARLYNAGHAERRWLLVLQYPLLDKIDLYLRYPDMRADPTPSFESGDFKPFSSRAIRYRQPNFWVELPPNTEVELLVRVQSESSMQVPLSIYTMNSFAEMERDAQFGIGLYNGILVALFFYNLVLWLAVRDSTHFWYMFHVAGFGLVLFCLNGLAFEYLWPNNPWLANHAIPLSMCVVQLAMQQFSRIFLELERRWPLGDRIALGFIAFFAALGVASLFLDYRLAVEIGTAMVFPGVLFILYTSFRSIRQGYRPARLFLLAWFILLLATPLYAAVSFGVLEKNFVTEYGLQIGSAIEMILLSFALAYRYASLRKENERIVREANEQLEQNVARRTSELSSALEQLADANSRLRESNRRDALTGVYNRRHFREVFEQLLHQSGETRQPLGVLLIDVDHFKKVNDTYGHLAGDECLRTLARTLDQALAGEQALMARFGGEEFVVVLPSASPSHVLEVAETLRRRISEQPVHYGGREIAMTASIGAFAVPQGFAANPDAALHQADDALYAAKNAGRNRVHAATAAPA
jgi:two-component system, sensor histidine kinase LadS